jgi:hypothetical protein
MSEPDICDRSTAPDTITVEQMVKWLDKFIGTEGNVATILDGETPKAIRAELLKSRDAAQPLGASGYRTSVQHGVKSTAPDAPPSALDTELMALLKTCEGALKSAMYGHADSTTPSAQDALRAIADFRKARR